MLDRFRAPGQGPLPRTMKANDIRPGMVLIRDGEEYRVTDSQHRSPGNKRAFMQVRMVRLKDGTQREEKLSSTEEVEKASLESLEMQYLYQEGGHYHFMNTENYEQLSLNQENIGNGAHYLLPNTLVQITFCQGKAIGVALPTSMEFEVIEAEPGLRTATATASYKNAKIETGHIIKVPQFVQRGDRIKVNPNKDEYIERAK